MRVQEGRIEHIEKAQVHRSGGPTMKEIENIIEIADGTREEDEWEEVSPEEKI